MHTKFVFTLICNESNLYLEQARISAYSLKFYNPSAYLVVVLDEDTMGYVNNAGTDFQEYVDEFIVEDVPDYFTPMQRSRYIKTRLRSIVSGDFLYLDTDTVIADRLDEIDCCEYDLAGVHDSNRPLPIADTSYVSDWYINSHVEKLAWPTLVGSPNYNGGVLYVKDSPIAHEFYARWHNLWQECVSKGVNIDMIALCRANKELGFCIKELPGKWNCQIQRNGLSAVNEALIIHCFTGGNLSCYYLCEENLLRRLKTENRIDDEIKKFVKNARKAFYSEMTIVPSSETAIFHTSMALLYKKHQFCFKVLNAIAHVIMHF